MKRVDMEALGLMEVVMVEGVVGYDDTGEIAYTRGECKWFSVQDD